MIVECYIIHIYLEVAGDFPKKINNTGIILVYF